jgi:hypothetical protein
MYNQNIPKKETPFFSYSDEECQNYCYRGLNENEEDIHHHVDGKECSLLIGQAKFDDEPDIDCCIIL